MVKFSKCVCIVRVTKFSHGSSTSIETDIIISLTKKVNSSYTYCSHILPYFMKLLRYQHNDQYDTYCNMIYK